MDLIEEPQVFFLNITTSSSFCRPPLDFDPICSLNLEIFFLPDHFTTECLSIIIQRLYIHIHIHSSSLLRHFSAILSFLWRMTSEIPSLRSVRFLAQCASAGLLLVCSVGTDYFNDETLERRRDSNIPTRAGSFSRLDAADHIGLDNEDPFSVISFFIKSVVD